MSASMEPNNFEEKGWTGYTEEKEVKKEHDVKGCSVHTHRQGLKKGFSPEKVTRAAVLTPFGYSSKDPGIFIDTNSSEIPALVGSFLLSRFLHSGNSLLLLT